MNRLRPYLYYSEDHGRTCLDNQATAIKNASVVSFVGHRFLREIIDDDLGHDLVITDMTLPKMTGIDLSRKTLQI